MLISANVCIGYGRMSYVVHGACIETLCSIMKNIWRHRNKLRCSAADARKRALTKYRAIHEPCTCSTAYIIAATYPGWSRADTTEHSETMSDYQSIAIGLPLSHTVLALTLNACSCSLNAVSYPFYQGMRKAIDTH